MTAEAWVCRQFLGVGGPGPSSSEAAEFLLANGPEIRAGPYNLYYWYYGTLAMYQHGGASWTRWNAQVRDAIVGRQRLQGHRPEAGTPTPADYGTKGAGSTAPRWRPCRSKSTTATSASTTLPGERPAAPSCAPRRFTMPVQEPVLITAPASAFCWI